MMLHVPGVLTSAQVAEMRAVIDAASWEDGNTTSGKQSRLAKQNLQLPEASDTARKAGAQVREAVTRSQLFMAASLAHTVYPPLFNRYGPGATFGDHVDNAMRFQRDQNIRVRTDLSATLFLSEPEDYDGGELVVEDTYGSHEVKLPAGDLILYPAASLHRVMPITRGERVASFFWVQSLIRDDAKRALLFDLDVAIQTLAQDAGLGAPAIVSLTGTYQNLLRMWAEL
ncbi:MAG: Fe2+-dependent dioxygenase [Alphaproteobacteria bacterium]|nr:Fe2+-dependent dioxygenase [Alphaproteobacteria bacterium]MBU1517208.1 Fe2+-dependent dioxygenase [Alphaproteobacteria bacterium]MBU2093256.1 Fe2+-dependent dioxygenase [Alphaproteobacteria bacterium]MBU2153118.1 Fe2+-dependent dioxygenase [Alphaproteobacteria bacterium]MBU2307824.1 Fe2+-dependent dioxygenase [Alphaproteobacteria bacterium]